MATDIVQSLFGVTPQAYQQAQQDRADAQALQYAKLDPFQQANFAIGRGATGLAGALGGQDPQLQMLTEQSQMMRDLNINDPNAIMAAAQRANQIGNPQLAFTLVKAAEEAQKRFDLTTARQQGIQAQQIARTAFSPGGQDQYYGKATELPLRDDEGNLMPGAGVSAPSYDINRVAPQLMALGAAGQAQLLGAAKVNEEMAKADKAAADAISAQQKARFAGPAEQAAALKATADAETARVGALFAERLQVAGLNKTNWDVANLQSQIKDRSAKLALDQQTTAAIVAEKMSNISKNLTDIPADTRKLINESAVSAASSKQSADQFNGLASRIEAQGGNYGIASSASDFLKKAGGFQGGMTQLKQEYSRLRNTAAIKSLPPGPATDKDIQLALSGFPSDTARAGDLAAFLRGMAKLQDIDSAVSNAKTDWLAQNNGTLTRTNRTLLVGDFSARPGETFNDLSSRIVKDVNARYAGTNQDAQRQSRINQIPTNQPISRPATGNIINEADAIISRSK